MQPPQLGPAGIVERMSHRGRRLSVVVTHLALVVVANHLAFLLRYDAQVPPSDFALQMDTLPWLVAIRGLLFLPFGVYQGVWRYVGLWDFRNIIASIAASSVAFYFFVWFQFGSGYPRSIFVIDALVLACLCGGLRLASRTLREGFRGGFLGRLTHQDSAGQDETKKLLIFGAGQAGELIARDIRNIAFHSYRSVGFVDDDRFKVGQRIHGVPVLGTREDLGKIIAEHSPDEVLIAMPAASAATVRGIVRALEPYKVPITVLPNLRDILDGVVTVKEIRSLAIEDLLPRAPVGLNEAPLRDLLVGRRVLVTGAGGSIGSELCLQIAALHPYSLVLYERNENGLYSITNQLTDRGLATGVSPVIGDITDAARLDAVFAQFRPEVVFHAAAHKHVPLMEANPCEAVKNNVIGTRLVAEAAVRHGAVRFVLISTDKAVNPSSVMGTTKRIAELMLSDRGKESTTTFLSVRFGNVLGSNGSVVPRFLEQIKSGGPITITHPEIRRYFMLLPEAVHLILHVAGQGRDGGTYVLDMGEQIKIADMARNLIRLSGLVPDEDIKLAFVGLRPGEKLFEELIGPRENVMQSSIQKVFEVTSEEARPSWFPSELRRLQRVATLGDSTEVMRALRRIVPEFTGRPWEVAPEATGKLRNGAGVMPLLAAGHEAAGVPGRGVHKAELQLNGSLQENGRSVEIAAASERSGHS
jgi:FlaA1/EpsC-like NDP-sugar epimerase